VTVPRRLDHQITGIQILQAIAFRNNGLRDSHAVLKSNAESSELYFMVWQAGAVGCGMLALLSPARSFIIFITFFNEF